MDLAKRIRDLRNTKNISVYKLSKLSEISENYIRKVERGESQISVFVLEKLLTCLGTTLSEFFYDEGETVLYPTDFERELLEYVRVLDQERAELILHIAKLLKK